MTATIVEALAGLTVSLWSVSGVILSITKSFGVRRDHPALRTWRWTWAELRPFYLSAVAVKIGLLVVSGEMLGWNTFFSACYVLNWFYFKDIDEDDRWKRRKAKLLEKVTRKGGRLVAAPVNGGAS